MKKSIFYVILLIAVIMLCFAGCSSVKTGSFSSKYYNGDAYEEAVDVVMEYFKNFKGCTMERIDYAGDKEVKEEAKIRKLAPEQVMVLESTFTTDEKDHKNGLEPNHKYEHFKWILTRDTTSTPWTVTDHGYA